MKWSKLLFVGLFFIHSISQAQNPTLSPKLPPLSNYETVIAIEQSGAKPAYSHLESQEVTPEQFADLLKSMPQDTDLIVSTDSADVLASVVESRSLNFTDRLPQTELEKRKGLTRFIPFGPLVDKAKQSKLMQSLVSYKDKLIQGAKNDRIGVLVLTINTAYDSYIWMHASQYSDSTRLAVTLYGIMISVAFGLDKDLWAQTSDKIQNRIVRLFDRASLKGQDAKDYLSQEALNKMSGKKQLAINFLTNLSMVMGIQAGRMAILSLDQTLSEAFSLTQLSKMAGLSLAMTFGGWGWSRFAAGVDAAKYPFTKTLVRRWYEIRNLIMGHAASTGKLMQPSEYGWTPWMALALNGVAGMTAFSQKDKITQWFEESKTMEKPRTWLQKLNEKNLIKHLTKSSSQQCQELFGHSF